MKIKLSYKEACSVLRQELGQYLALNDIDPDIEIEIEKATTGLPTLTAVDITDELKRRSEERKQEKLIEADRINNPPVIGGKMNGEPVEDVLVDKSLELIRRINKLRKEAAQDKAEAQKLYELAAEIKEEPVERWPVEKSLDAIDHVKELADGLPKNQATQLLEKMDGQLTWQPDGETPPPSADAFMAWANGKKVMKKDNNSQEWWQNFHPTNDPNTLSCCHKYGITDEIRWNRADWQEYTDA